MTSWLDSVRRYFSDEDLPKSTDAESRAERTDSYRGNKLVIKSLFGAPVVEVGSDAIEIFAAGKTSHLDELQITQTRGTVTICGPMVACRLMPTTMDR